MNLYYTVTSGYNNPQPNPDRSLGGYKSSTLVINDDFGNLFDEISLFSLKTQRDEYHALMIKNEAPAPVKNVSVQVRVPDDAICSYKLAVAPILGKNKYNQAYIENVATIYSKPFHAEFVEMVPGTTLVLTNNLNIGEEIGFWICRHIDFDLAKSQYEDICKPDPSDPQGRRYIGVEHPTIEKIDIEINFEPVTTNVI